MVYAKTVEIPASRRVIVDIPQELPTGVQAHVSFFINSAPPFSEDVWAAEKLKEPVEMMAYEYAASPELTAFCALDGEAFH